MSISKLDFFLVGACVGVWVGGWFVIAVLFGSL